MKLLKHLAAGFGLLALSACGGGDSGGSSASPTPTPTATSANTTYTPPAQESLSIGDVQRIIAQAVGEAQARNQPSVIAVTDRVGNVLAVFKMTGAADTMQVSAKAQSGATINPAIGLQGLTLPSELGAIAKAVTGAYLSSAGNGFSTRTASMIVQQEFPPSPSAVGLESGPLFGVQFSQLPCSDLNTRYGVGSPLIGPKRSPLGLAADPGGFPLYKNGVVVGGIGVMGDGQYAYDPDVSNVDNDPEEAIALAGTQGYAAPDTITADKIPVDGTNLRFSDMTVADLHPLQTSYATAAALGQLIAVRGYNTATVIAGSAYGSEASGYRAATASEFSRADAFVLSDGSGHDRYPIKGGADAADVGTALSAAEATALLEEAFKVAAHARAQIRRPLNSQAQITVAVVDTYGDVLGLVRSPDAPIFGTDVALQKARTVAFFDNPGAAGFVTGDPDPDVAGYMAAARSFFGDQSQFTGKWAFAARSIGNLAREHFPDGEQDQPNGPFGVPAAQFNPFATGLQLALVTQNIVAHVGYVTTGSADTLAQCSNVPSSPNGVKRLANGMQIFSGGVPIYRGGVLVGAIGVSGDGIDQDDMVSFLGANNGGARVGGIGNAASAIRADQIVLPVGAGTRLRYVNCPVAPFLDTSDQNVCEGL